MVCNKLKYWGTDMNGYYQYSLFLDKLNCRLYITCSGCHSMNTTVCDIMILSEHPSHYKNILDISTAWTYWTFFESYIWNNNKSTMQWYYKHISITIIITLALKVPCFPLICSPQPLSRSRSRSQSTPTLTSRNKSSKLY